MAGIAGRRALHESRRALWEYRTTTHGEEIRNGTKITKTYTTRPII